MKLTMETDTVSNVAEAEDGEILNDDDTEDLYTPLVRPNIPLSTSKPHQASDSDDNISVDSSSDSDSSTNYSSFQKKRKKFPVAPTKPETVKKKNYNIWCTDLQAEVLTNNLIDCSVNQTNERSRDVESYNYKLGFQNNKNNKGKNDYFVGRDQNCFSNKRKHNGAYVKEAAEKKATKASKSCGAKGRCILGLTTNISNSSEEIAEDIANKLCEEKEDLILRAVEIIGKEPVISLFEEVREIEANGGMLIMNGARRRTPGGVFFYLLKSSETISRESINLVFLEDKKTTVRKKKHDAKEIQKKKAAKFKAEMAKDYLSSLSSTEKAIKELKARKLAEELADSKSLENNKTD